MTQAMPDPTAAFTAFGRVTARIAACEQIMRLALGEREVERANRNGDSGPERFQPYIARMLKWDLGQLSHRLQNEFKLPKEPWLQILKDAKELRNTVAHDFWSPYNALLQSDQGIELVVRHCNVLDRHFAHLARGLAYATGVNLSLYVDFVSTNEWTESTKAEFDAKLVEAERVTATLPQWPDPIPGKPLHQG